MQIRLKSVAIAAVAAGTLLLAVIPIAGQAPSPAGLSPSSAGVARTEDKKPNLNGIWQAFNTANWDILAHEAQAGPRPATHGRVGGAARGDGHRRRQRAPVSARGAGEKETEPRESDGRQGRQRSEPIRQRRPRAAVLSAGRAARQLHAVSVSDFPEPRTDHDRVRIQVVGALDLHGCRSRRRRSIPGWDGRTAAGTAIPSSST